MEREPLLVLDASKDTEAVKALVETVKQTLQGRRLISVVGISSDKAHRSMIHSLSEVTERFILTEHRVRERTARATRLQKIAMELGIPAVIYTPVHEAIEQAKKLAGPEDVILVTGSVFLVGEAREYWYPASDILHEARNTRKSGH
jgi:dihydrofolate synthase/folylpolyglutamate synthase